MKKWIALLLAALSVAALVACGGSAEKSAEPTKSEEPTQPAEATEPTVDERDVVVGGWRLADSPAVTDQVRMALNKAVAARTENDDTFEPVASVSSQLVAGMNYLILCKQTRSGSESGAVYALVTVYEDLQGNAEITDVRSSSVSASYEEGLDGGWGECADPEVSDELKAALSSSAEYRPLAMLAQQVVAGMKYRLLCLVTPAEQDAAPYYAIAEVFSDFDGNTEIVCSEVFGA